ncbi:MAG: DUF952 domain-containing protein [Rhizobiales bacterium]|nr:DUF952 domain-containing protein [Hyphomicrobiales bacterium]MBI3673591.1 DUF952 domain-containing protein [Hyphomicrobiales bacterium]
MEILYKICAIAEWRRAEAEGRYRGSAADRADGFIHLSAAHQVRQTAARHFAGQAGLVLVGFAADGLKGLRWEASRGGALFPHVYGEIDAAMAVAVTDLPWAAGGHRFPDHIPA